MKKNFIYYLPVQNFTKVIFLCVFNLQAILAFSTTPTHYMSSPNFEDSLNEKKVDYLMQVYFSGKNKQDLSGLILATLQQMEGTQSTTAVAKQYTFLSGIKDKVDAAKNSCETLEMVANGIYAIDAAEAIKMGIRKPKTDSKASINAADALSSLSSLNTSANNMAVSSWLLSGGKTSSLSGGVLNQTNKLGQNLQIAGQGMQMFNQGKDLLGKLPFGGGDKPCKDVPYQTVAIGEHALPSNTNSTATTAIVSPANGITQMNNTTSNTASGLTIVIKNVTYNQFSSIASSLEKVTGIQLVNSDDFKSNTGTLQVACSFRTKELVDRIVQSNSGISFEIENTSSSGANLIVKSKK